MKTRVVDAAARSSRPPPPPPSLFAAASSLSLTTRPLHTLKPQPNPLDNPQDLLDGFLAQPKGVFLLRQGAPAVGAASSPPRPQAAAPHGDNNNNPPAAQHGDASAAAGGGARAAAWSTGGSSSNDARAGTAARAAPMAAATATTGGPGPLPSASPLMLKHAEKWIEKGVPPQLHGLFTRLLSQHPATRELAARGDEDADARARDADVARAEHAIRSGTSATKQAALDGLEAVAQHHGGALGQDFVDLRAHLERGIARDDRIALAVLRLSARATHRPALAAADQDAWRHVREKASWPSRRSMDITLGMYLGNAPEGAEAVDHAVNLWQFLRGELGCWRGGGRRRSAAECAAAGELLRHFNTLLAAFFPREAAPYPEKEPLATDPSLVPLVQIASAARARWQREGDRALLLLQRVLAIAKAARWCESLRWDASAAGDTASQDELRLISKLLGPSRMAPVIGNVLDSWGSTEDVGGAVQAAAVLTGAADKIDGPGWTAARDHPANGPYAKLRGVVLLTWCEAYPPVPGGIVPLAMGKSPRNLLARVRLLPSELGLPFLNELIASLPLPPPTLPPLIYLNVPHPCVERRAHRLRARHVAAHEPAPRARLRARRRRGGDGRAVAAGAAVGRPARGGGHRV